MFAICDHDNFLPNFFTSDLLDDVLNSMTEVDLINLQSEAKPVISVLKEFCDKKRIVVRYAISQ